MARLAKKNAMKPRQRQTEKALSPANHALQLDADKSTTKKETLSRTSSCVLLLDKYGAANERPCDAYQISSSLPEVGMRRRS